MSSTSNAAAPTAAPYVRRATRLGDLDRTKGIAILLVVFGHLVARQTPPDVTWYDPLRIVVYLFHMPLFMYVSGYVTFVSGAARTPLRDWGRLAGKRATRLLGPFLLFGLAILCAKLLASQFAAVDNVPPDLSDGLRELVWDTQHSPATSVWYIAVLFVFCIATPPLLAIDPSRTALLAVAVVLYFLPLPPLLYLDRVGTYFLFFVVGGLAADAGTRWLRIVDAARWPALAGLAAVTFLVASGHITFHWTEGQQGFPYKWALLIAGMLSLPAIHGLLRHAPFANSGTLARLGRYVFVIYLLNTPFIGITKAVLLKLMAWDGAHFLLIATLLMLAGTCGPILTKRLLLRRVPVLDRMTD